MAWSGHWDVVQTSVPLMTTILFTLVLLATEGKPMLSTPSVTCRADLGDQVRVAEHRAFVYGHIEGTLACLDKVDLCALKGDPDRRHCASGRRASMNG